MRRNTQLTGIIRMKLLFSLAIALLVSTGVSAESLSSKLAGIICPTGETHCYTEVTFVIGKPVTWLITAQTSGTPGLKVGYYDDDDNWNLVVDTSVHSVDLNNKSTGDFMPPITGVYKVIFSNTKGVKEDTAAIVNDLLETVVVTRQYATEDGGDGDYNDSFITITSIDKAG